jgi:hypothetical protein
VDRPVFERETLAEVAFRICWYSCSRNVLGGGCFFCGAWENAGSIVVSAIAGGTLTSTATYDGVPRIVHEETCDRQKLLERVDVWFAIAAVARMVDFGRHPPSAEGI